MLSPDDVLQNRYRIVRQLGKGGMGAVYEARDQRLNTTVALKECLLEDPALRQQFEREAQMLARLRHATLPRVIDHFKEAEGHYLVMDFVGGADLGALLRRGDYVFELPRLLSWADQLLDALEYLHGHSPPIVHRDIKPLNLKLWSPDRIALLDFGLAKGGATPTSTTATDASVVGYTPHYAPLEQIQGSGTDARSDLYALAATVYHLATRRVPADALTRVAAIASGREDPLLLASAIDPDVPDGIARVLHRALDHSAGSRFASASEMRSALRECSGALPLLASPHRIDAPDASTAIEHRQAPAALPVFSAAPDVRNRAGALPVTELATNAADAASPSTVALSALSTAIVATPLWYSCVAAAAAGVVLAWWTGLWWGEFLTDDGFRYLAAIPSIVATIAAALSFGRDAGWWQVSASLCASMLALLFTAFAPPPENTMGYDLLFAPMVQTGAMGHGGYAYWLMGQLVLFAVFGGIVGAQWAARHRNQGLLAALSIGSMAAIAAAFLISTLSRSNGVDPVWATLGTAAAYLPAGAVFGLAVRQAQPASSLVLASGAFGLASTTYYLHLGQPADIPRTFGPSIMSVPLVILVALPLAAFVSALAGKTVGRALRRDR